MAVDEKTVIRSQFKPEIELDELAIEDLFTGTSKEMPDYRKNEVTGHQEQFSAGTNYPLS